jgi:type III secretory pathway component EscV
VVNGKLIRSLLHFQADLEAVVVAVVALVAAVVVPLPVAVVALVAAVAVVLRVPGVVPRSSLYVSSVSGRD